MTPGVASTVMAASPWAGLGQREQAARPAAGPLPDKDQPDPDFERDSIQRTVPATQAPPLANPFTGYLRPGQQPPDVPQDDTPATEPATRATPQEPQTMPATKKPRAVRKPAAKPPAEVPAPKRRASTRRKQQPTHAQRPGLMICGLLAGGPVHGTQLMERLAGQGLTRQQIYGGLHQAKKLGRVQRQGDMYSLLPAGAKWLQKQTEHVGTPPTLAATTATPAQTWPQPVATFEPVVPRSFRCAVFSDGGFCVTKGDRTVELTAQETAELVRYLERMAEAA